MPDDDKLNAAIEYEKKLRLRAFGIPRSWIEEKELRVPYAPGRTSSFAEERKDVRATSTFQRRIAEAAFRYLEQREPQLVGSLLRDVSISERERFDTGDVQFYLEWTHPVTRNVWVATRVVNREDLEQRFAINSNLLDDIGKNLMYEMLAINGAEMLEVYLGMQSVSLGGLLLPGTRARPAKDVPAAPVMPRVRRLRVGEE